MSDAGDFSKPTGRTNAQIHAKLSITSKIPQRDEGARTAFFCPDARFCGRTKASDHKIQQSPSST
jgi:hypothetical protein